MWQFQKHMHHHENYELHMIQVPTAPRMGVCVCGGGGGGGGGGDVGSCGMSTSAYKGDHLIEVEFTVSYSKFPRL